jgi:hypothetical protein
MSSTPAPTPASPRLLPVGNHCVIPHDELAAWYEVTPHQLWAVSRTFTADFCFMLECGVADSEPPAVGSVRVFTEYGALLAGWLIDSATTRTRAVQLTRACVALRRHGRPPQPLPLAG